MRRALKSLLELAVKFARSGTTVRIAHATDQREIRLFFEADGCGVPPESVPRFFQLMGTSPQLVPNGDPGLAPALAERIVSLYGGSVSIENLSSPGVRLTVRLKKAIGRGESADSSR
jgi:K+-sensing histidine kinase KdpD